ncbi:MAG TPA: response regulator, partial [Allocoleopsis sp.]
MTKILVIDDTADLLEDITELLQLLEYEVIWANNGLTGLNLAKNELPDLILCDIMMPELNGYEVFDLLQSSPDTATIPFIFLSAKADKSEIRFGMNLGADDYITKPFELEELKSAIAARLNKKAMYKEVEKKLQESENVFRKLAQKEELINLLTKQIRNSLELKKILNTTVESIRKLLQIHRCSFYWYRTDVEQAYFELIDEAIDPEIEDICSHNSLNIAPVLSQIILAKHLIKIDDVNQDILIDKESKKNIISAQIQALLGILIQNNTGKTGVIICEQLNESREWNEHEIQLLQAVGDQLAIAIEQGELYAKSGFTAASAKIQAMQLEKTLTELKQTQLQLIQTEKMSSLGQLVAGVAHEINNPVNFIYGNVNYIKEYVESLINLVQFYQNQHPELNIEIEEELGDLDIDFILDDLPKILNSMEIGADRIQQIVLSLKNFSRHDQ